jgi:hypothetical protein
MTRLVVAIDAKKAKSGAEGFNAATRSIRASAKKTAEEISATNKRTIENTIDSLDEEIERRTAVQKAMEKGTNEARIEAKAQEVIIGLRQRGISLSDQELRLIREKTRASQELANAQAEAYRKAANEERDNTEEGKTERMKREMAETRGFVGDLGDAFAMAGQDLLGLDDVMTQDIDTTIALTEKFMAFGEFLPVIGPAVAGVVGFFTGLVTSSIRTTEALQELRASMEQLQEKTKQSQEDLAFEQSMEIKYLGAKKLRMELEELARMDVDDVTSQIRALGKTYADFHISGSIAREKDRNREVMSENIDAFLADRMGSAKQIIDSIDEVIAKNEELGKSEDTTLKGRKDAWDKAVQDQAAAKAALLKYQEELKQAMSGLDSIQQGELFEFFKSDGGEEASEKLAQSLGKTADEVRRYLGPLREMFIHHGNTVTETKNKEDAYRAALAKTPSMLREVGGALRDMANTASEGHFDYYLNQITEKLSPDAMKQFLSDKKAKEKAEADAAKNSAKSRADSLAKQKEQIAAQEAIWAAYQKGGEEAAKLEEKYQGLISGQGFNEKQRAEARKNAEQIVANEKRITEARKNAANAASLEEDMLESVKQGREKAIEAAKKLAEELEKIEDEATKPGSEFVEKQQSPMQAWMEQYDSLLDAQANFESMMIGSFDNIASSLAQTLWGVDVDWRETMKSMGIELTALLLKMLAAAALKAVITGATGGAGGLGAALGSGIIGDLIIGSSFHSGGTVGAGGSPVMAPASLWAGAPRFHGGLKPDEFPAILQTGEEVLSRRQVAEGRGSGRTIVNNNYWSFPGIRDSRGMDRSLNQGARRLGRMLGVNDD